MATTVEKIESREQTSAPKERAVDARAEAKVMMAEAETHGDVADLLEGSLEGVESAEGGTDDEGKGFGENDDGKVKDSAGSGQPAAVPAYIPPPPVIPEPTLMKKQVVHAIREEIRVEEKKVFRHYIGWQRLDPTVLQEITSKIRRLKTILSEALDALGEALTSMYRKWVLKES